MHLADAFIQSDLHCIQVTVFTFLSALAFPGNRTHDLGVASAMLYYLSYRKALKLYTQYIWIWHITVKTAEFASCNATWISMKTAEIVQIKN